MTAADLVVQVRELHAPTENEHHDLVCATCVSPFLDIGSESAAWPCSTARLVYTDDEMAEALEAEALLWRYRWHHAGANPSFAPSRPLWELLPSFTTQRGGIKYETVDG